MNGNDVVEYIENNTDKLYHGFVEEKAKEFVKFLIKEWDAQKDMWFYMDWFVQLNEEEFNKYAETQMVEDIATYQDMIYDHL